MDRTWPGLICVVLLTVAGCESSESPKQSGLTPDAPVDAPLDLPVDLPGFDPEAGSGLACDCGPGRSCPAGAIFAGTCGVCKCGSNGNAGCQAIACLDGGPPQPVRCEASPSACTRGDCVFDQGCGSPSAYCATTFCSNTFSQTFCGCDGETFTSDCPRKAYRHVGPCSPTCPAGQQPFWTTPGCLGEASQICAASDEACATPTEVCSCDGQTLRICSRSPRPFRFRGSCSGDASVGPVVPEGDAGS